MKRSLTGGITAAVLATTLVAPPAHAEYYRQVDAADASGSLTDVYYLRVRHGGEEVAVVVAFDDLRRSSSAGVSIYFDTVKSRRGPEFVLSSGLGDGTDYVLSRAVRWQGRGEPVDCDYRARLKFSKEKLRTVISRDCFGDLDKIGEMRASVKMGDNADSSHPVVDWVPERRKWTNWLRPGS